MTKIYASLALLLLVLPAISACAARTPKMNSSMSMMILNSAQPFVSQALARRLAMVVIEDRYPSDVFLPDSSGLIVDGDKVWRVKFENTLVESKGQQRMVGVDNNFLPESLTIVIRKSDAAILDIE